MNRPIYIPTKIRYKSIPKTKQSHKQKKNCVLRQKMEHNSLNILNEVLIFSH